METVWKKRTNRITRNIRLFKFNLQRGEFMFWLKLFRLFFGQYPVPSGARYSCIKYIEDTDSYHFTIKYQYPGNSEILYEYFDGNIILYKKSEPTEFEDVFFPYVFEKIYFPLSRNFHYKPEIVHSYGLGVLEFSIHSYRKERVKS